MRAALLSLTTFLLAVSPSVRAQQLSVLHVKVTLVDPDGKTMPVPRHALLISDNPASSSPRLVTTGLDGTVEVRLRPGNYTVESDHPVPFHGKAYQWTQTLDVAAGRDATLELTAGNAESEPISSSSASTTNPLETDPWVVLPQWQDSVVALWTPTTRASGFVVDARGLIATSQRAIGAGTPIEAQITPTLKVAATVLAADAQRDVAVLWIDPAAVASIRPVPLACDQAASLAVAGQQEIFAIGSPLRQPKGLTPGTVSRVTPHSLTADLRLARGSAGGPVFTADGAVVGVSSLPDEKDENSHGDPRVVRTVDVCEVVAAAAAKMQNAAPPGGAHLPVEPQQPFPMDALKEMAPRRAGNLNSYQIASANFDVTFVTPVLTFAARYQAERIGGGLRSGPATDFGNWWDYVEDYPPVVLIRATPKLVEGFWTTVARGAAQAQGMAIPPIKRPKSGFSRMRVLCGETEVTPIHPFTLEYRLPGSDPLSEGLYAFDPGALGPQCASVTLVLYAEKEPQKADTRVVEPRVLQQVWQDFEPYRSANR